MLLTLIRYLSILLTGIIAILALAKDYAKKKNGIKMQGWLPMGFVSFLTVLSIITQYLTDVENRRSQLELTTNFSSLKRSYDSLLRYSVGNGYCLFELTGLGNEVYVGSLNNEENNYPVHSVSVTIVDAETLQKCRLPASSNLNCIDRECYYSNSKFFQIPEVANGTDFGLANYYNFTTREKTKKLEIKMYSRGSKVIQQTIFQLSLGRCLQSYRLFAVSGDSAHLMTAYNGIPSMEIDWDKEFPALNNRWFSSTKSCPE